MLEPVLQTSTLLMSMLIVIIVVVQWYFKLSRIMLGLLVEQNVNLNFLSKIEQNTNEKTCHYKSKFQAFSFTLRG